MKTTRLFPSRSALLALAFANVGMLSLNATAAQLTWDPLANGGVTAGSGNWDTTVSNWYNTTTDVAWSQTSTTSATMGAVFNGPDAAAGTYQVTNDGVQMAVTNLQINANGYVFNGANAVYVNTSQFLTVAANKTVTFNCNMAGSGTDPSWQLLPGAVMNVTGNLTGGQQLRLVGDSTSAFNLSGTASAPGIFSVLGPVNVTNGSLIPTSSTFIGYENLNVVNGTTYTTGVLTVSGASTIVTINGNILIIGRSSGTGTLNVQNGTFSVGNGTANRNLAIDYDGSAGSSGTVNVSGGILNVGAPSFTANQIAFFDATASVPTATGTMTLTGGTVNTWGGMTFGLAGGTGTSSFTQSGGALYVGATGISKGGAYTGPFSMTVSGGQIGALANWSSSIPMTLTTTNGNITFLCEDANTTPHTITLSGVLSGNGGLNVNGGGTLALSGANNYTGTTTVSNGTLEIFTSGAASNGPVIVDATLPPSTLQVQVGSAGQFWSIGNLSFTAGTPTADFEFGALSPSTTVAPVQVNGSVNLTATPNVIVGGTAITTGTYPLIKYTGTESGAMPGSVTLNIPGGSASGFLTNIAASKVISLVVTSSTVTAALSWAVGNGAWDINTTANWKQFGSAVKYLDGDAVLFDDTATGTSPITVTLNTIVNPLSVTANNSSKSYIISGTGSITGSGGLTLLGNGAITLNGTNTYSGGTTLSAGQLNINNGGDTLNGSAIGTGPLTINAGAIDNTSGSDVTIQTNITENWNGGFTYVGSSHGLNTGSGAITMNASLTITNGGNNLTIGANINDNGTTLKLTKTGPGTLTLPVANSISGGVQVSAGTLALGDPNAAGGGVLTIAGGAIDNTSGSFFDLTPGSITWSGNFSFLGTTNLGLSPNVTIPNGLGSLTFNVVNNTLFTLGDIINNNTTVIKTGNGIWNITGSSGGLQSLGLFVEGGEVILSRMGGQSITGGNNIGMTVFTNALAFDGGGFQIHSGTAVAIPITLSGGTWDLNGFSENVDKLFINDTGTLRMGAANGTSTIKFTAGLGATLSGNADIDVTTNGILNFNGVIGGGGNLVKVGLGTLNLASNNTFTGSTVVSNGTVALIGTASISNSTFINLAVTNAALDLTGTTDTNLNPTEELTLVAGQTLGGFGTVTGIVQTLPGAIIAPGSSSATGTLSITGVAGTNILGGITAMKLNKTAHTNDVLSVSGSLMLGGTLSLSNISGSLANGDSFTLFNAAGGLSGSFSSITPSRPGFPAFGLAWNAANLGANGSISVTTAAIPSSPKLTSIHSTGTTVSIAGTNGPANEPFVIVSTTNILAKLNTWTPVSTNAFNPGGGFNISFGTPTNSPQQYFAIMVQ